MASLYIPVDEVSAVSEYGYKIAEGLHRCTTKTSNWYLNESSPVLYRDRISSVCDRIECNRTFHLYRLKNINGLLIVADNKCSYCKGRFYFDGPVEGNPFVKRYLGRRHSMDEAFVFPPQQFCLRI